MKHNIALIIISTGLYHKFIEPLLNSARVHFMPFDNVTFFVFTDKIEDYGEDCVTIPTKHEPWPGPTIHRYKNIVNSAGLFRGMDYVFYCDVDCLFVAPVGREILCDGLTAVLHPGFAMFPGKGSWGNNEKSTSFTDRVYRIRYYAGGFQGGKTESFLLAAKLMANAIEVDKENDVIAEWHDETHWNKTLSGAAGRMKFLPLDSSYCMVEQEDLRKLWKIDHLKPKLIALAKDHKAMRT